MTQEFGYGRRNPADFQSQFNTIAFIVRQITGKMAVSMPVKVLSCTTSGGLAAVGYVDAQPLINQIDGAGFPVPHARLYRLPYFRIQGGKNAIIMDPEVGDIGFAIFADEDASIFKETKAQANPGSRRRFDQSDGFYVGGFLNGTPNQYIQFQTGVGITVKDVNGNTIVTSSSGITITDKNNNSIVMNAAGITITDDNGNTIVMDSVGIHLNE